MSVAVEVVITGVVKVAGPYAPVATGVGVVIFGTLLGGYLFGRNLAET